METHQTYLTRAQRIIRKAMNTFIRIFSIVCGLHIVGLGLILLQPGCQLSRQAPPPDPSITKPSAPMAANPGPRHATPGRQAPRVVTPPRFEPMRPSSTTAPSSVADAFNADVDILEPLPLAGVPEAAPVRANNIHEVKRGDTLSGIARQYGTSLNELLRANNLRKDSIIQPGQEITIPTSTTEAAPASLAEDSLVYLVRRGDTLGKIARRYDVTVNDLRSANGLRGDNIQVGQQLRIPGVQPGTAPSSAPSPSAAPVSSPNSQPSVPLSDLTYTVRSGDTLGAIARRHGVSVANLRAANGISGSTIYVGQKLALPQGATAPTELAAPSVSARPAPAPASVQPAAPAQPAPIRIQPGTPARTVEDPELSALENLIPNEDIEIPLIPMEEGALPPDEQP